jgi:hypothetical protein
MTIARICAALGALLAAACSVSQSDERQIGAANAAQIDSEMPLVRDSVIVAFVTPWVDRWPRARVARTSTGSSRSNSPGETPSPSPRRLRLRNRAIEQADRLDWPVSRSESGTSCGVTRSSDGKGREGSGGPAVHADERLSTIGGASRLYQCGRHRREVQPGTRGAEADSGASSARSRGIDRGAAGVLEKLLEQQKSQPSMGGVFRRTRRRSRVAPRKQSRRSGSPADLIRDTPEFHAIQEPPRVARHQSATRRERARR